MKTLEQKSFFVPVVWCLVTIGFILCPDGVYANQQQRNERIEQILEEVEAENKDCLKKAEKKLIGDFEID